MSAKPATSVRPPNCRQPFATIPPTNSNDIAQIMVADALVWSTLEYLTRETRDLVSVLEIHLETGLPLPTIKRSLLRLALTHKVVVDRAQFRSRKAQKVVTLKQVRARTGIAVRSAERALFRLALADKVVIEDARYRVK